MHADDNGILYLDTYHPKWGGSNPRFDEFSESILILKDGPSKRGFSGILGAFEESIRKSFEADYPELWRNCAIAVVPSHDPRQTYSGIRTLAMSLCDEGRVDATEALVRIKAVRKQATGGPRDIKHHLESIRVEINALPKDAVLLVIDDVTTTGNSLLACRKILTRAGVRRILLFSLSKTARYED